jgi:hypothetical protein
MSWSREVPANTFDRRTPGNLRSLLSRIQLGENSGGGVLVDPPTYGESQAHRLDDAGD